MQSPSVFRSILHLVVILILHDESICCIEVRRTVPVKLDVTESDAALLHDTIDQYRDAANLVVRHARDDDGYVITSKRRLHDRTYEDVREATDLQANLVQAARNRAAEALKSVVTNWKRGK